MTFIPQTEQVSTIDSDWPEAWHSTGLNTTGSGSGSGFSNFQSRTNGGASLGSFGNNQDPFQSHLLSVGNSAEQNRHQHCTTDYNGGYEPAGLVAFNKGQNVGGLSRQRCCWSSRSCRRFQPQPLPPPPPPR